MRAPINLYFDVTPIGRVLNRFSKDVDVIDFMLPVFFAMALQSTFILIGATILCVVSAPWFAVVVPLLIYVFNRLRRYVEQVSRELKRLDATTRSPILSLFAETLNGQASIRAYGSQQACIDQMYELCRSCACRILGLVSTRRYSFVAPLRVRKSHRH